MSFSFAFGGDDIDSDTEQDDLVREVENCTIDEIPLLPPKKHTLQELLSSLPSQISYNLLPVHAQREIDSSSSTLVVPRRSVFDIRAQLMAEANPEENDNDTLLAGLERGDLKSGIYEGGFKTWECSLDLASLVADLDVTSSFHLIELGAGSAVPALVALGTILQQTPCPRTHLTLCDYNEDVLRLATAPNVFLATEVGKKQGAQDGDLEDMEVEDIDQEKLEKCIHHFEQSGVSFDFVSGAWGDDFLRLLQSSSNRLTADTYTTLILASETIYSPNSTKHFVHILMRLLEQDKARSKAWVAAKKVYFGVGGGVDDFIRQVEEHKGVVRTLLDVKGAGVGRVVLEITADP